MKEEISICVIGFLVEGGWVVLYLEPIDRRV